MITVVIVAQIALDALSKYLARREVRLKAEDQLKENRAQSTKSFR